MHRILEKHCKERNGLFLFDPPMGTGKTHAALQYMFEAVHEEENRDRKFFFITSLKKNLPQEKLRQMFKERGEEKLFEEKFLFADSNLECILRGYRLLTGHEDTADARETGRSGTQKGRKKERGAAWDAGEDAALDEKIPECIRRSGEFKDLVSGIRKILACREASGLKALSEDTEQAFSRNTEPNFRRILQNEMRKAFPTRQGRINAIRNDKNWKWVADFYPAYCLSEKQIIFMSTDKFLSGIATAVEPSFLLYDSEMIDGAVIFIDEFDASKETLQNHIIRDGLRGKTDYVELFNTIHRALRTHEFSKTLRDASAASAANEERQGRPGTGILESFTEKAERIFETYCLRCSHKTEESGAGEKCFLFQDCRTQAILDGDRESVCWRHDGERGVNLIRYLKKGEKTDGDKEIRELLGELGGFLEYFMKGVYFLALNYRALKSREMPGGETFRLESAVRSVLSEFSIDKEVQKLLTPQIMLGARPAGQKDDRGGESFDSTFYEKGFRYFSVADDETHDMRSEIRMCGFRMTAEKIMAHICGKAMVVGISATANLKTAIGNYDTDYLRIRLQDRFQSSAPEEDAILRQAYEASVSGYGHVNICVKQVGGKEYSEELWLKAADDAESAEDLYHTVETSCADEYCKMRYFRIACAFREFLAHDDIRSFLCVLTKHPRPKDPKLSMDLLMKLFTKIGRALKKSRDFKAEDLVAQLDGDEYEAKRDEILGRLEKGEKIFVLSVYQTVGAGQNLQYGIPQGLSESLVRVNELYGGEEKDFDAIYLDRPTNLLAPLTEDIAEENFVKHLFQLETLQETGELSQTATAALRERAFRCFADGHAPSGGFGESNPYRCRSVRVFSTRVVMQALGRICRTNVKQRNIYIYADSAIGESILPEEADGMRKNPEVEALFAEVSAQGEDVRGPDPAAAASLLSERASRRLSSLLPYRWEERGWDDKQMREWKELRELVLSHPTMSEAMRKSSRAASNLYVRLPERGGRLYYAQRGDYSEISVSFEPREGFSCVDAENARLSLLMAHAPLRRHFEQNGWATGFAEDDCVMTPALYNNIYKGALGEAAGKFLFSEHLGLELEEITEGGKFEMFDYRVPGKDIYVDFKNWHAGTAADSGELGEKIARKAKACGAAAVLIVNIAEESRYKARETSVGGVRIVRVPALLAADRGMEPVAEAWDMIRRVIDG